MFALKFLISVDYTHFDGDLDICLIPVSCTFEAKNDWGLPCTYLGEKRKMIFVENKELGLNGANENDLQIA